MTERLLEHYHGRHAGADVVVFGSGPSLSRFDFGRVTNKIRIAVNETVMKVPSPHYFFTSDGSAVSCNFWEDVRRGAFPVIASSQGAGSHIVRDGKLAEDREICFYQKFGGRLRMAHTDKALIFGTTSPHCAVHFAHLLGARRIIVVGCDCGFAGPTRFYWEKPGERRVVYSGHALKQAQAPRQQNEGWLRESFTYWTKMRTSNPHIRIEAWGGRLETLFPKYKGD